MRSLSPFVSLPPSLPPSSTLLLPLHLSLPSLSPSLSLSAPPHTQHPRQIVSRGGVHRTGTEREKDSWTGGGGVTEPHRSPIRPRRPRRRRPQIGPRRLPRRPLPDIHLPPLPPLPSSGGAEAAEAAAARRRGDRCGHSGGLGRACRRPSGRRTRRDENTESVLYDAA